MLVQATEIKYDYTNNTVAAVGNVQIYYSGATVEADEVIYDQKTKRLRAQGNVRLTEPDGKITYGQFIDLTDDYRDGFVDSLRLETVDDTRFAAARADRDQGQLHGAAKRRLHRLRALQGRSEKAAALAGPGRPDHPRRGREDALFRGRARRVLRRAARLCAVHVGARSDGEAQERLSVSEHHLQHGLYGFGIEIPYFWALAPNYDLTTLDDDDDQAGRAVSGRMAPAPDGRLVLDQGRRHFPDRTPAISPTATVPTARPRTRSAAPSRPRANSR